MLQNQKLGTLTTTKIAHESTTPVQHNTTTKNNQHLVDDDDGKSRENATRASSVKARVLSTSSPDLLIEHFYQSNQLVTRRTLYQLYSKYLYKKRQPTRGGCSSGDAETDFCVVSSVPDDLNLCCDPIRENGGGATDQQRYSWTTDADSYASKNVNLFTLNATSSTSNKTEPPPQQTQAHTQHITTSYANLTLLNYSDENLYEMNFDKPQINNRKYASSQDDEDAGAHAGAAAAVENSVTSSKSNFKSEFSSLLDEITAHFDRNLSILNDQDEDYDPFYG